MKSVLSSNKNKCSESIGMLLLSINHEVISKLFESKRLCFCTMRITGGIEERRQPSEGNSSTSDLSFFIFLNYCYDSYLTLIFFSFQTLV